VRKKAKRALHKRIKNLAPGADVDGIVKLADAYAKVNYGAQGNTTYDYNQRVYREKALEKDTGF
jgi:hypothetical protein